MAEVRLKENETLESALKRFKRQCAKAGVLAEVRKREHYENPALKGKRNPKLQGKERKDNNMGAQSSHFLPI